MTLPVAPPITLQEIIFEFGAPIGTPLSAMVRGGDYVPDHPGTINIPTEVPISLLDFLGSDVIDPTPPPAEGEVFNMGAELASSSGIYYSSIGDWGHISPEIYRDQFIILLGDEFNQLYNFTLMLQGYNVHPQYFTSITIVGGSVNRTYLNSEFGYQTFESQRLSIWTAFNEFAGLVDGGNYTVTINY
jgi:hypothetical protein